MKKKQTKGSFLRLLALMLAVIMVIGEPAGALAAEAVGEPVSEETDAIGEDELTPEAAELRTKAFDEGANDSESVASSEPVSESGDEITIADSSDADLEALDPDTVVEVDSDDIVQKHGATVEKTISDSDYLVKRYPTRVTVKNNLTGTTLENDLYAVLVYTEKEYKTLFEGVRVKPGQTVSLTYVNDNDEGYSRKALDRDSKYTIWIGTAEQYTYETDGVEKTAIIEYGFLGYTEYDDDGNKLDATREYNIRAKKELATVDSEEVDNGWKNGTEINMKAVAQNNMTVKISWSTNAKLHPEQKDFKKYKLSRITEDSAAAGGIKYDLILDGTKKSVVVKDKIDSTVQTYLLECFDKNNNSLAKYVTATAPYLLNVQPGYSDKILDFTFTRLANDENYTINLDVATANKAYDAAKAPGGFHDEWSTQTYGSNIRSIESYFVKKNVTPTAGMLTYYNAEPQLQTGKTYFARMRVTTNVGGVEISSVPSNVVKVKVGPEKLLILTSAGVEYNVKTPAQNQANAEKFLNDYYMESVEEIDSELFVHETNTEVCFKSGMIFFLGADNEGNIKSYDLYRSEHPYGGYKKVKSYALDKADKVGLIKCKLNDSSTSNIYALEYNNFTPEKEYYYSVCAVSKTASSVGGLGDGELIKPEQDTVQGLFTQDMDLHKITLGWQHDDCVKQYWLYRSDEKLDTLKQKVDFQRDNTPLAKISASKYDKTTGYVFYTDSKKLVPDTSYYYYVRPVYDTSKASKKTAEAAEYNTAYCSEVVEGVCSALYVKVGGLKASSYASEQMSVSFNKVEDLTKYRIWRAEFSNNVKTIPESYIPKLFDFVEGQETMSFTELEKKLRGKTDDEWNNYIAKYGWTKVADISSTGKSSFIDNNNVNVGKYYVYMIQGATADSASVNFSYTGAVQNKPLAVTNAKAELRGSGSNLYINVSWSLDSKERSVSGLAYQISIDGGSYRDVSSNSYQDYNVSRGTEKTYRIRVRHTASDTYSSAVEVKYSLPKNIEVSKSGDGTFSGNTLKLKVGESATISYRAVLEGGKTSQYNNVSRTETPAGTKTIEVTGTSSNSFTVKALEAGAAVPYTLSCAGLSRTIYVQVVKE